MKDIMELCDVARETGFAIHRYLHFLRLLRLFAAYSTPVFEPKFFTPGA